MTNKQIEMVVFDMAGTTIDEQNVVYKTLHKAILDFGVKVDLETVLEFGAGKEKHKAIKDILVHLESDELENSKTIFENFKLILDQAYKILDVKPIKGVQEVMQSLRSKGVKVVLNTGYSREVATLLLGKIQWNKGVHYDALITASDVEKSRPHPEMIQKAMKMFDIKNPSTVLKAGDSAIDIEEGKNAHCGLTVGVLSGAQTKKQIEKAKPDFILKSLSDLRLKFN